MPSKLKKAIGAVKDQTSISLAKVANNSSINLEVAVLKATTHDDVPMEDRYIYEILELVSSNKVQAAACARAIGKRIGRTRNWIVALKSLMLVLRLFQDGDPYFPREVLHAMKLKGAKILNLSGFRDDSNSSPWDYTAFIRTFALYLDERLDCFLTGKLQRRYNHREREPISRRSRRPNEPVRDMKPAMLLDKISYWQRLLDRAVATRPTGAAKTNRLVQIALYAVVQESFDLYKDVSDGLALLLDSFFHLQYQSCVHAFQTCVKASKQFEELSAFYSLCKSIGVGRTSEYPSVHSISEELIETLQEFLKDQTSFPSTGRSPNRPLLFPAPANLGSSSSHHHSYGQSTEFSETTERFSEMNSEFGSQSTSLEDLISATELTGASPSISIDLEAYSFTHKLGKNSERDDVFNANDTGSSKSLPVTNSFIDLVSLEEWPEKEHKNEQLQVLPQEPVGSTNGWEVMMAETDMPITQTTPLEKSSSEGWEVVLAETAIESAQPSATTTNTFNNPSLDLLYHESSLPQAQHYNPFLADTNELMGISTVTTATTGVVQSIFSVNDTFSLAPTFQATPTFSAQNPNDSSALELYNQNDPFAAFSTPLAGDQMFNGTRTQQNFQHEQELWLQYQNKIIAKHIA